MRFYEECARIMQQLMDVVWVTPTRIMGTIIINQTNNNNHKCFVKYNASHHPTSFCATKILEFKDGAFVWYYSNIFTFFVGNDKIFGLQ